MLLDTQNKKVLNDSLLPFCRSLYNSGYCMTERIDASSSNTKENTGRDV